MKKLTITISIFLTLLSFNYYSLKSSEIYRGNAIWTFESTKTTDDKVIKDTLVLERENIEDKNSTWNWKIKYKRSLDDGSKIEGNIKQEVNIIREKPIEIGDQKLVIYRLDLPQLDYLENRLNKIFPPVVFQKMDSSIIYLGIPVPTQEHNSTSVKMKKKWSPQKDLLESDVDTNVSKRDMSYSVICDYKVTGTINYRLKGKNYKCWIIEDNCKKADMNNYSTYYYSEDIGFVYFFIRFPDYTVQIKLINFKKL